MLAAMVAAAGGEPWILPTVADSEKTLDRALAKAAEADLLILSGGVSAGKFDLVQPALARAGARFHFTGVRIQPGKPLVFGGLEERQLSARGPPHAVFFRPSRQSSLFGSHLFALRRACARRSRRQS